MDTTLKYFLKKGNLLFFGYEYESLPKVIGKYDHNRIKVYSKKKLFFKNCSFKVHSFQEMNDINEPCDVLFLDNKYTINIIKGLPINALYIGISINNPIYYPFLIIGIIRRIILKKYSFHNIKILKTERLYTFWLFLKRNSPRNGNEFYLSRTIGIKGFLYFLHKNNINYIVPRFFEDLPKLKNATSDLDLIVSEKDVTFVKEFLLNNEGDIRVDVWSSCPKDNLGKSYFTKKIIKGVLDRKEIGPCKSKIPSSKDYLNLIIYHSLYHKGYLSGIKSNLLKKNFRKTNKYSNLIKELELKNNIKVGENMEEMHSYMQKEGWAPDKKIIRKLCKTNYWLRDLRKII